MIDKSVLKKYIIGLAISVSVVIITIIGNFRDSMASSYKLYTLPLGETTAQQSVFFYLLAILIPYLGIFIGYGLGYMVVRIFCQYTKFSKRIEFVGFASISRTKKYLVRRYLIQLFFGALLCTNIWIALVSNESIMTLLLNDEGLDRMVGNQGEYLNFVFIPWYWLPSFVTALVFSTCTIIMDSGLVSVKNLPGHSQFSDTERVGDKMFAIVKGYAGISVIISFIGLIQTPRGNEGSLVIYPIVAILLIIHVIIAMDMFRTIGVNWIFKAVKPYYDLQMIKLNFEKQDVSKYDDLISK